MIGYVALNTLFPGLDTSRFQARWTFYWRGGILRSFSSASRTRLAMSAGLIVQSPRHP